MKNSFFFMILMAILCLLPHEICAQGNGDGYYEAFVTAEVNSALVNRLKSAGVQVTAKYDGFVAARISNQVTPQAVMAIDGVKHVTLATPLVTCSDSARYYSRVDAVHQGQGYELPYTGKGVIVGVIDCGFDFNHINLCDDKGNTRVKAVYMPLDNSGTSPVIHGMILPGSCYEDAAAIRRLTTDDASSVHGTMTAGIAAGAYRPNGWYGMAPDADIVACGMPEGELNDVRVANCISYIVDYASRAGKPCVINISLGTNVGPHDGSSFLTRIFNQVSGPGLVIVVSAGNDGDAPVCMHRSVAGSDDTVTTLLSGYRGSRDFSGTISAWSSDDTPIGSRVIIVTANGGDVVYTSSNTLETNGKTIEISSDSDDDFGMFFKGGMSITSTQEASGRYNTTCHIGGQTKSKDYILGLQYLALGHTELSAWATQYAYFNRHGFTWAEKGSAAGSISDLATTDSVISVGSYNSKQYVPLRNDSLYLRINSRPRELSYYSAFGPDENGIQRPDVCAPGSVMIASANRYDQHAPNMAYWQPSAYFNGEEYPYCPDLGTSMSAPVVTGAIALWMQANPNLSTRQVRDILNHSSYKDSYVNAQGSQQWGSGKLDVAAGLRYILQDNAKKGDINLDGAVNVSDVSALISILIDGTTDSQAFKRADVNNDGDVNISDLNVIIDIILKS